MLVTSSKNKSSIIVNDIYKKIKTLTTDQKTLVADLVPLIQKAPNYHKDYDSEQIIIWFINPILQNQYFTIYENNRLAAFLTYGYLDTQTENKWLTKGYDFKFDDWDSGKNLWLIDCIAPWGHAPKICKIARKHVAKHGYANKKVNFKRIYKTNKEKLASAVI
jgi:hemolysin-activating ACP:hemolysin acyltransferase